jgi:ferredoxin-NADP reductase
MNLPLIVQDVKHLTSHLSLLTTSKPAGFSFIPGHSCLLALPNFTYDQARAFTFVSYPSDDYLSFLIKRSPDTTSITHQLIASKPGDTLAIRGLFGTHRATGPGLFIASGIGIAPFLAIARAHPTECKQSILLWSVKSAQDIVYETELKQAFKQVIITLTQEKNPSYKQGRITQEVLKGIPLQNVQTCGSYEFNKDMKNLLATLTDKR